ncbi:hypothetical protein ACLOJK_030919 [Asimina triloba]
MRKKSRSRREIAYGGRERRTAARLTFLEVGVEPAYAVNLVLPSIVARESREEFGKRGFRISDVKPHERNRQCAYSPERPYVLSILSGHSVGATEAT